MDGSTKSKGLAFICLKGWPNLLLLNMNNIDITPKKQLKKLLDLRIWPSSGPTERLFKLPWVHQQAVSPLKSRISTMSRRTRSWWQDAASVTGAQDCCYWCLGFFSQKKWWNELFEKLWRFVVTLHLGKICYVWSVCASCIFQTTTLWKHGFSSTPMVFPYLKNQGYLSDLPSRKQWKTSIQNMWL